jgi:hypothetical protein
MYDKPTPQGAGNGWKGWYKEHYFRSLRELMFMIQADDKGVIWVSAESIRIPYLWNGNQRTYRPDFRVENRLIEIKPKRLHTSPLVSAKQEAAKLFCATHGLIYELIDMSIDSGKIYDSYVKNLIRFSHDYEQRFLDWCASQGMLIAY